MFAQIVYFCIPQCGERDYALRILMYLIVLRGSLFFKKNVDKKSVETNLEGAHSIIRRARFFDRFLFPTRSILKKKRGAYFLEIGAYLTHKKLAAPLRNPQFLQRGRTRLCVRVVYRYNTDPKVEKKVRSIYFNFDINHSLLILYGL